MTLWRHRREREQKQSQTSDRKQDGSRFMVADPSGASNSSWGRARATIDQPKRDRITVRNEKRESFTKFHDVSLAEAVAIRDAREVAEHVITTLVWLDESKPAICNGLEEAHNRSSVKLAIYGRGCVDHDSSQACQQEHTDWHRSSDRRYPWISLIRRHCRRRHLLGHNGHDCVIDSCPFCRCPWVGCGRAGVIGNPC